jgi:hypothetical protein
MCHHSMVTGSAAAADGDAGGATLAPALVGAELGAELGAEFAPGPQALAMIATAPIAPAIRFRDTTTSSR